MDWWNLLYLAVGGVLTTLGGFVSQLVSAKISKNNYEQEKRDKENEEMQRKKEDFFINVVNLLTAIISEIHLSDKTKVKINNIRAYFLLYLNQEWCDRYWNLVCDILETRGTKNFKSDNVNDFNNDLKKVLFNK